MAETEAEAASQQANLPPQLGAILVLHGSDRLMVVINPLIEDKPYMFTAGELVRADEREDEPVDRIGTPGTFSQDQICETIGQLDFDTLVACLEADLGRPLSEHMMDLLFAARELSRVMILGQVDVG